MKMMRISIALFGAALLCSAGVFAKDNNKASLDITQKLDVQGQTIKPGKYKVEWSGSGDNVQVMLIHNGQTVATIPAHVTDSPTKNAVDAYVTTAGSDGSRTLTTIYPGGQKTILNLEQNASAQHNETPGAK